MPIAAAAVTRDQRTRSAEPRTGGAIATAAPLSAQAGTRAVPVAGDALAPPKIYYLHYPMIGALADWPRHLARCRAMGFDYIAIPPPFAPGRRGNPFLTDDFAVPHPALGLGTGADAIAAIAQLCARHQLKLIVDLVIDRVAADGAFARAHRAWFRFPELAEDEVPDPRHPRQSREVALARVEEPAIADALCGWWGERLAPLAQSGTSGFRCLHLDRVPAALWRQLAAQARQAAPGLMLLGWTPPLDHAALADFVDVGFDYVFAVAAGDRKTSTRFIEDAAALRRIAPVIAVPELPFGPRLARIWGRSRIAYRRAIDFATAVSDGVLMPGGFEFAASRPLDPLYSAPPDLDDAERDAPFALADEIAAANTRLDRIGQLDLTERLLPLAAANGVGAMARLGGPAAPHALLLLSNHDLDNSRVLDRAPALLAATAGAFGGAMRIDGDGAPDAPLAAGEVRVLRIQPNDPILVTGRNRPTAQRAVSAARIAIENVTPCVDNGRFAVKRVVGDRIEIEADIFVDGHEALAAALLWRPIDQRDWHQAPMVLAENDRWRGVCVPDRIGRYVYAVEAWCDHWAGLTRDIGKKRAAGQDVTLDVADAMHLAEAARKRAGGDDKKILAALVKKLSSASGEARTALILADEMRAAMSAADDRPFLARSEPDIAIDVDRPQARFASWYELFPRSATDDPARHGTFADVIARLPAIAAMGFDVLYFPPIHPIGTSNRKGRNNALTAAADDPGSPYAIGGAEGGHTAIHPALGTLEDFRRLRAAAAEHRIELALDFAIQCSPDHPWLKEHPNWFSRRSDGSIRYAENPPKKYEDIVNVDFDAPDAVPDLWLALRDVVLFWIAEGVRIFRVDNPHTKPLPFWEWLIADVRGRFPEVIFLAEAFTRPKPMYRLAKLGFTQSYSYFTWRNTKRELTDYMMELTASPPKDFFRPNFFVNTPDINPFFLQSSGRPGFLIRAALAATLSGLWGMYSGFEQCEAAPLPGREEYLDSEKYQIRVRDPAAPGNIVAEITALNRIRRGHVALQSHLGVTFYNAFNEQVLVYGKTAPHRHDELREMILVAVNLDPREVQQATFELPLWEFGLADHDSLSAEDLMRERTFTLTGKMQQLTLDPNDLPFVIWRLSSENR